MTTWPEPTRYDKIQYRRTGRSGLMLPAVSLGLWHNFGGVDPFENGRQMVRRAFDLGITHFDLANNYGPPPGSAEENFGKIFKILKLKVLTLISPKCNEGLYMSTQSGM